MPSVLQLAAPMSMHWLVGIGACPAGMLVHVPGDVASAHDLHVPVQAVEQQTLCEQLSLAQSLPALHEAPLGRLVQTLPMQMFGETQSASTVQFVRQAAPLPQT